MKERIGEIINELKNVISINDLNISDNVLFAEAVSCWRGEQVGKSYTNVTPKKESSNEISSKQQNFIKKNQSEMKKLGFDFSNINTKSDASKIISEFISKKQVRDEETIY